MIDYIPRVSPLSAGQASIKFRVSVIKIESYRGEPLLSNKASNEAQKITTQNTPETLSQTRWQGVCGF